ncbi:MAG: undecaprenyldiphospho-muramoylpentapeptide beta-N-acetylglucosaminyltransferase [Chlamydiae bacterium]|nr:undecaprenyldiphospho-muramoylpentapeptide beta-N-acetylglucosaminyltransferase [Chlamydiota bacterium]MBI3267009.1 undecaprenyldiphospho-muramoylpentapeptide beta-N-acetylglucosaminyltransferase [Chlamydiota bacterium]
MKVAICAGKTGGHIFPALAVARRLKKENPADEIYFIGTQGGLDQSLLSQEGFLFEGISGSGFPTGFHWKIFKCLGMLMLGFVQAVLLFGKRRPDAVLSFGSFISCAPVLAAHLMKIPVVIHEANLQPGRANRLLSRWANVVCTTFPSLKNSLEGQKGAHPFFYDQRVLVTGLPIRERFLNLDRVQAVRNLKLASDKFTILVMGGSQGSQKINTCLLQAIHQMGPTSKKIQIVHVTGKKDYEHVMYQYQPNGVSYQAFPFLDEVEQAFGSADLFVGRAGASTLAEVTFCGLPSLLIPYPHAIENHQWVNADYLVKQGAAFLIDEKELSPQVLAKEIARLVENHVLRKSLSQHAKALGLADGAARIVKVLKEVVGKE